MEISRQFYWTLGSILFALLSAVLYLVVPHMVESLNEGVTLKQGFVWSFILTVVTFVIFAIVAGDGLLGEIQFMIAGFFAFFLTFGFFVAWVF